MLQSMQALMSEDEQVLPQNPELDSVKDEIAMQMQYGALRLFEWHV